MDLLVNLQTSSQIVSELLQHYGVNTSGTKTIQARWTEAQAQR
jgi:hypothetical protein